MDKYKLDEKVVEPGTTWENIDFVDTKYGNSYGWLTLKSIFSQQIFVRTILYGGLITKDRYWFLFDKDPNAHLNSATISDARDYQLFGLKQDWDFEATKNVYLKWGFEIKNSKVKYDYFKDIENEFITADDSLTIQIEKQKTDLTQNGNQLGLYLSSRFQVLSPLTVETGIRYDYASHSGDKLWSPRINMVYSLAKATFLRAGWGYFYQSQSIDELQIPFDEFKYNPAELAQHYVLGFEHFFDNGVHFRVEGYYKKISNTSIAYRSFANIDEFFPEARTDLFTLFINKATARGIEFYLKYDTGDKFSGWLSYVLSDATEEITDIQYDGKFVEKLGTQPLPWDQRHTINIEGNYRLSKDWHFNLSWQYRNGWPYTAFTVERKQRIDGSYAFYHAFGTFNNIRYPAYHRLDFRVNKHYFTSNGKVTVFLHVINLYNSENISSYDHEILKSTPQVFKSEIVGETWFGIMPFFGVSWEF
jgi:outer membrane receptor protein involved in Fe transport